MRIYASNGAVAELNGQIVAGSMGITLDDASDFPAKGPFIIAINDEIILIESRAGNMLTVALDGRGYDGTAADDHADEDPVYGKIVAAHINSIVNEDEVEIGEDSEASGDNSIAIGHEAEATEANTVAIGYQASATVSNYFVIGNDDSLVKMPGALQLTKHGAGITLTSPDGTETKTIRIDNSGDIEVV